MGVTPPEKFPASEPAGTSNGSASIVRKVAVGPVTGCEKRHTVGSRISGKIAASDFDYDAEAAYQFGSIGSADISAYMAASELGYTFFDAPTLPRLHVGFDYASGDDDRGDRVGTFNQLFPLGHAYFGHIDTIARQNIVDLSTGVTVKPWRRWTADVTGPQLLACQRA